MKKLFASAAMILALPLASSVAEPVYDSSGSILYPAGQRGGLYCRTPKCDELFHQSVIGRLSRDKVVLLGDRFEFEQLGMIQLAHYVEEITKLLEAKLGTDIGTGNIVIQVVLKPGLGAYAVVGHDGELPEALIRDVQVEIDAIMGPMPEHVELPFQIFYSVRPL